MCGVNGRSSFMKMIACTVAAVVCGMAIVGILGILLNIVSVFLHSLLVLALLPATLVLGAMYAKVIDSFPSILTSILNQYAGTTSHHECQQNKSLKSAELIGRIVSYSIFDILLCASMSYLGLIQVPEFAIAVLISYAVGAIIGMGFGVSNDSALRTELNNAADAVNMYVLSTINSACNSAIIKKPAEFLCSSVEQIFDSVRRQGGALEPS